jgi:NRPS condensation-like uncharacterized protein
MPKSTKRVRSALLTVWLTPAEIAKVRARAKAEGLTVSDLIRNLLTHIGVI